MESYDRKIKKLNVLERLLKKELVTVKRTLGESEIVKEVNEEIRQFLTAQIEIILNAKMTYPSSTGTASQSIFSSNEAAVLKELATKILKKAAAPETGMVQIDPEERPPETQSPRVAKGHGPVWEALQGAGYDPDTFKSLPEEERKEIMKQLEKGKK